MTTRVVAGFSPPLDAVVMVENAFEHGAPKPVWTLQAPSQRPQVTLRFSVAALQRVQVLSAALTVTAGGEGGDVNAATGVVASLRGPGWWAPAEVLTTAPLAAPQTTTLRVDGKALVTLTAMMDQTGEVSLRLQPASPNGRGLSHLVVDAPQMELWYRR